MKTISPYLVVSGGAIVDVLRSYPRPFYRHGDSEEFHRIPEAFSMHPSTHSFVPDAQFSDRLKAVPKGVYGGRGIDLSHSRLIDAVTGVALWQPIDVPPAYDVLPSGAVVRDPRSFTPTVSQAFRLVVDSTYFGGEIFPAGTVVHFAGFKTTLGSRSIEFEHVAQFPDRTYRHLPRDAVRV